MGTTEKERVQAKRFVNVFSFIAAVVPVIVTVCVCVCACMSVGVFIFHPRFASGLRNFELASTFWSRVAFFLAAVAAACDIA